MMVVQKIETGYLQLLRIVLLIAASIAIIVSVFSGIQFLVRHNASPAEVKGPELKLDSYQPGKAVTKVSDSSDQADAAEPKKDQLLEDFIAVIEKHGKEITPGFHAHRDYIAKWFYDIKDNQNMGRDFLVQVLPILDAAFKRPDVIARAKENYGNEVASLMNYYAADYAKQMQAVSEKKEAAHEEALVKQASSWVSLYIAASMFGGFVVLVLLIVLLKIERNLRDRQSPAAA